MRLAEDEFYHLLRAFADGQTAITMAIAEVNSHLHAIDPTHDLSIVIIIRDTVQDMALIFATLAVAGVDQFVIVPDDVVSVLLSRCRECMSAAYCFVRTVMHSMHVAGLETHDVETHLTVFNYHFEDLRDGLQRPAAPVLAN